MAEVVEVNPVYRGWSAFSLVSFRLDDGAVVERCIEDHGDAACVLPYDPERRVALLVRQFRAPVTYRHEAEFCEPPAGLIDDGESPEACAIREAEEETGLKLRSLEPIGRFWSSPGSTTERSWLYLAQYATGDRIGKGGGADPDEHVELIELPLAELAARADAGELQDLKLAVLALALMRRRPELFLPLP
ncbi:MAG TPA: NUDIX hydrolase [Caulobacteraceae bacterium]|nr:NUDIX hydrolase [Caulobacteraceae bacterium]